MICENCKHCLDHGRFATKLDGVTRLDLVKFYVCDLVKDAMLKIKSEEDFERKYYLDFPLKEGQTKEEWFEEYQTEENRAHYGKCKKFEAIVEGKEL